MDKFKEMDTVVIDWHGFNSSTSNKSRNVYSDMRYLLALHIEGRVLMYVYDQK